MTLPAIHPKADVQSSAIGTGTKISQFVLIRSGAQIGNDCEICSHCLIEDDVVIGNRVTIKNGVQLTDGARVMNDVYLGANALFVSGKFPQIKNAAEQVVVTTIHNGAAIGAGAVIYQGIAIGSNAVVAAGAVVTRSVPPNAIVEGTPAKIVGYVDTARNDLALVTPTKPTLSITPTEVEGVTLHKMLKVPDIRGSLTAGEFGRSVPFSVKRYFMVFDVPSVETRGEHAHRECHQFLICVRGSCAVVADDGKKRQEFLLNSPDLGVHLPPMVWGIQYQYSADAVLLVFASHYYDDADYIRDYSEFRSKVGST